MGKKKIEDGVLWQIIAYSKLNYKKTRIAALCKCSRSCISRVIKTYKITGGIKDKVRTGRPRISSKKSDAKLFNLIRNNPYLSFRKLSALWSVKCNQLLSKNTAYRRILELGLRSYNATQKQFLSTSDKKKRLEWCKQRKNWGYDLWATVIFSDESNFQLINRKNIPKVVRFPNEKFNPKFVKPRLQAGGGSIGIWGCISINGSGVCETYTGRLNQLEYRNILENSLIPSIELLIDPNDQAIFQQDNAPCHKARSVMTWFEENGIDILPWPARSPDLNPIEHLWNDLDLKLLEKTHNNLAELQVALTKLWNEIPKARCAYLIESMPKRIELCIQAQGGYFKY